LLDDWIAVNVEGSEALAVAPLQGAPTGRATDPRSSPDRRDGGLAPLVRIRVGSGRREGRRCREPMPAIGTNVEATGSRRSWVVGAWALCIAPLIRASTARSH
jgi:hypothetical protein